MQYLIWAGAVITVVGVAGIIAAAVLVARQRREGLSKAQMQRAMAINLGAFFLAILGLMAVVIGVILR